jgi:hypothetical protein
MKLVYIHLHSRRLIAFILAHPLRIYHRSIPSPSILSPKHLTGAGTMLPPHFVVAPPPFRSLTASTLPAAGEASAAPSSVPLSKSHFSSSRSFGRP